MKSLVLKSVLTLATLTLASLAHASDLTEDLKTPFKERTNPFGQFNEAPLAEPQATQLKTLLSHCAYNPISALPSGLKVENEAHLDSACAYLFQAQYETGRDGRPYIANIVNVLGGLNLTIVSWDGGDSDGGDNQAIGVYDASGNRIAVYPSTYVDGNVVDGIAHVLGLQLPKIKQ